MFLEEYGLPELNEELCIEAIKNKEYYINNLKNDLLMEDPLILQKDDEYARPTINGGSVEIINAN